MAEKSEEQIQHRITRSSNRLVSAVEAYLSLHSNEKFSLQETALEMHVNGSYLLRVYKAQTGHTLFGITIISAAKKRRSCWRKATWAFLKSGKQWDLSLPPILLTYLKS